MKYLVCENENEAVKTAALLKEKNIVDIKVMVIKGIDGDFVSPPLKCINPTNNPDTQDKLFVRCFGNFDVFAHGEIISFTRSKSKELFAYMVDKQGALLSTAQLRSVLWDDSQDTEVKKSYTRTLIADIRRTLADAGYADVLINKRDSYGIDVKKISCDYYDFLGGINQELFNGEYMSQYSWGENTLGLLVRLSNKD